MLPKIPLRTLIKHLSLMEHFLKASGVQGRRKSQTMDPIATILGLNCKNWECNWAFAEQGGTWRVKRQFFFGFSCMHTWISVFCNAFLCCKICSLSNCFLKLPTTDSSNKAIPQILLIMNNKTNIKKDEKKHSMSATSSCSIAAIKI